MGELAVLPGLVFALGVGITIIVDVHGVFHFKLGYYFTSCRLHYLTLLYKLLLALRDATVACNTGRGAKVIYLRAVVKRNKGDY